MTLALHAGQPGGDNIDSVARLFLEGESPARLHVPHAYARRVHYAALGLGDWLCRVPKEEQKRWTVHVPRNPEWDEPDDGAIFRHDGRVSDQKVFFHVRSDLEENLLANGIRIEEPWRSWIIGCNLLREAVVKTAGRLALTIDRLSPGMKLYDRLQEAERSDFSSVLRVLSYEMGEAGHAKPHFDRNGLSFQLGASDDGLYFGTDEAKRRAERPKDEEAIVFPGTQLEKVSNGLIRAARHGSEPATGSCRRWSVVCFVYLAQ